MRSTLRLLTPLILICALLIPAASAEEKRILDFIQPINQITQDADIPEGFTDNLYKAAESSVSKTNNTVHK